MKRELNVSFAVSRDFHIMSLLFSTTIPVATTWLVWFLVTFGQPSFSSSVSSISTIIAEAHQVYPRYVRDDQNVTVLITQVNRR